MNPEDWAESTAEILCEMIETYSRRSASPGRGTYDIAMESEDYVFSVRCQINEYFVVDVPERVIFTSNSSDAIRQNRQELL